MKELQNFTNKILKVSFYSAVKDRNKKGQFQIKAYKCYTK